MRDYGKVSTSLWGSQKWSGVPDDGRLLYLYLHTCPHVNSVGCFVLREGYACADLGWQPERFRKAIATLSERYLVAIDTVESVVRIIDFLKHDPFTNPKHADGAIRIAKKLPDCHEKLCLFREISGMKHVSPSQIGDELHRLEIGYADPIETQNPLPEPEPEKIPGAKAPSSSDDDVPDQIREAFDAYNEAAAAAGWPKAQSLTSKRKAGLRGRLKDAGGIEGWRTALDKARASPHCCGQNQRGWTADLDFLLQQSSFTKLMEGSYDNRSHNPRTPRGSYTSGNRQPGGLVGAAMRIAGGCPDDFDGRG